MSSTQTTPAKKTLFTEGFLEDPYPIYQRFLEEGSIHYVDWGAGIWAVFRYADCSSILKDPRLSANRSGALLLSLPAERRTEFAELARMLGLWMLFIDAPEHSRLRKLMNKGFSPAVAESLRPQIEAIVDRILEPLRHASEAELMHEIAHPLPVQVIAEMLGLPGSGQANWFNGRTQSRLSSGIRAALCSKSSQHNGRSWHLPSSSAEPWRTGAGKGAATSSACCSILKKTARS